MADKDKKKGSKPLEASITLAIIRKPSNVKFHDSKIILDVHKSGLRETSDEAVYIASEFAYSSREKGAHVHSVSNAGALWAEPGQRLSDDQRPHDTSIRFMNLLLGKQLGFASQWIPAPTPMLLNKQIVSSMIKRFVTPSLNPMNEDKRKAIPVPIVFSSFENQWRSTWGRRLDSNFDLHFDFMYFAFMMGEYTEVSWDQLFDEFDTDNSGYILKKIIFSKKKKRFGTFFINTVLTHFSGRGPIEKCEL